MSQKSSLPQLAKSVSMALIPDMLVQSKRDKPAAIKLMRKLMKKYGFVPDRLITDDLRSYGAAARDLGIDR